MGVHGGERIPYHSYVLLLSIYQNIVVVIVVIVAVIACYIIIVINYCGCGCGNVLLCAVIVVIAVIILYSHNQGIIVINAVDITNWLQDSPFGNAILLYFPSLLLLLLTFIIPHILYFTTKMEGNKWIDGCTDVNV